MTAEAGPWRPEVGAWTARRTWDGRDVDPAAVAEFLRRRGRRVSVVIPALDEEATVAGVVEAVASLRADGLVHEVLVVDGGSQDGTVERARGAGAQVIDQAGAAPDLPAATGKGDALWKGVARTTGDIVAFVDADVRDLPGWWVPALVAPLCEDDEVQLVKAAYERLGEGPAGPGGGRVTELTARPLLRLLWPHLAGVRQPLAGEYAARRETLTRLPFPHGYGVEIALLLGVASRWGADAIAQVELGERRHTHQPLDALGRMASEVLHAAATQLRREGRLTADLPTPGAAGTTAPLRTGERPPLTDVPAGDRR